MRDSRGRQEEKGDRRMKFAFILMGSGFDSEKDRAAIHGGEIQVAGVPDLSEGCRVAKELCDSGVNCIELCGAFGPEGAKAVIQATGGKIPVGYVTHLPEQDAIYAEVFGENR